MTDGKKILSLVRGVQKLNGEIASLIKTFDKIMGDKGYKNDRTSSVIRDRSDSLGSPELWAPLYMYRLLKHSKNKDDIIVLNIMLDNPNDPEMVQEPLLLCAKFRYVKGMAKKYAGEWDAWDLWFGYPQKHPNRLYSIKELELTSPKFMADSDWDQEIVSAIQEVNFLAVPLVSITDTKTLEGVLKPF